jgi:hypothetical protein
MNGIPSLYQMTPTGVPFRTGAPGESTSEQRYFVPGFSSNLSNRSVPLTPEQQANLAMATERGFTSGGGDSAPVGTPGSGVVGSSGTLGGIAQGVNAAVTGVQNALGPLSIAVPGLGIMGALSHMGVEQAMDVNEQADAAIAAANQQANQATVGMGAFGPQVTTAVDISPVAPPAVQDVSPLAALTVMNQQQQEEEEASPAAVAADVAATVAATADAVDAEAGATNAAAAAAANASDNGGGGGAPSAPGDAPSIGGSMDAGGSNDSGNDAGSDGASPSYNQGGVASLANRVQEKGRGQDTMLVHMTPKEVGGLQALAMAHGGSLTINPQTGLPEAGFLSSILPMVAGAALAATGVGAPMAAMLVGGGYGLATGSLSKGLMAGLGAFGGAGLGTALSAAGAASATAPALTGTAPGLAQAGAVVPQAAMSAAPGSFQAALPGLGVSTASSAAAPAAATTFAPAAAPVTFGNMASGIPALGTEAGRTAAMSSLGGGMGALKTVGMAAAPVLGGMGEEPSNLPIKDQYIRPFKYKARPSAEEDETSATVLVSEASPQQSNAILVLNSPPLVYLRLVLNLLMVLTQWVGILKKGSKTAISGHMMTSMGKMSTLVVA